MVCATNIIMVHVTKYIEPQLMMFQMCKIHTPQFFKPSGDQIGCIRGHKIDGMVSLSLTYSIVVENLAPSMCWCNTRAFMSLRTLTACCTS